MSFNSHSVSFNFFLRFFVQFVGFKVRSNFFGRSQIELQSVRKIVAVTVRYFLKINDNQKNLIFILPEIEIGREIDTLKEFNVTRFIWMMSSHSFIRNVNHGSVLDFVDCVVTYYSDPSSFCDQDYVVTFKKPDKTFNIKNV